MRGTPAVDLFRDRLEFQGKIFWETVLRVGCVEKEEKNIPGAPFFCLDVPFERLQGERVALAFMVCLTASTYFVRFFNSIAGLAVCSAFT